MIGVKKEYYSIFENIDQKNEEDFLRRSGGDSTKPCRDLILKENVTAEDIQDFKQELMRNQRFTFFPHESANQKNDYIT